MFLQNLVSFLVLIQLKSSMAKPSNEKGCLFLRSLK